MSTAQDIITRALRSLQVVAQGETPDADQLSDGLVSLNDLLSAWGNERLMVYQTVQETITLVGGQSAYDIGVGATSLNTSMPIRIERAFIRLNGIDDPLKSSPAINTNPSRQSRIPPTFPRSVLRHRLSRIRYPAFSRAHWWNALYRLVEAPHGVFYALHGPSPFPMVMNAH